jgi:integrase
MRVGEELFALRWQDVDWDQQTIYIVSAQKGGLDTRRLPIATELLPRLLQWFIEDGELDLHIVRWHGRRVHTLKTAWAKAKKKAGITRRLRPYDLRHAWVTGLLDSGVDPQTVGSIAGHKDKSTTMYVYHHMTNDGYRRAAEKVKSILK